MIILILGASHTGKTAMAQKLLEKYRYPYLSIDHLKMGLIRSHQTGLTPGDDEQLTAYLWPIVREMIKTAIENQQNLIVEGCYIPFDWKSDFSAKYLEEIKSVVLVLSENYIRSHFDRIKSWADVIEKRIDDEDLNIGELIQENDTAAKQAAAHNLPSILIEDEYNPEAVLRETLKNLCPSK